MLFYVAYNSQFVSLLTIPHAIGKSEAGCSYCPCREVLRLDRFCRTGTKSPNSPIHAGKLPASGPRLSCGLKQMDFSRLLKRIFAKNFRCTPRNRIPSF